MEEAFNLFLRHEVRGDLRNRSPQPRLRISYSRGGWVPRAVISVSSFAALPEEGSPEVSPPVSGGLIPGMSGQSEMVSLRGIAYSAAAAAVTVKTISDVIPYRAVITGIRVAFNYNDPWQDGVRLFAMRDESAPSGVVPVQGIELIVCYANADGVSPTAAQKSKLITDPGGFGRLNVNCRISVPWDRWRLYQYYDLTLAEAGDYYQAVSQFDVSEDIGIGVFSQLSVSPAMPFVQPVQVQPLAVSPAPGAPGVPVPISGVSSAQEFGAGAAPAPLVYHPASIAYFESAYLRDNCRLILQTQGTEAAYEYARNAGEFYILPGNFTVSIPSFYSSQSLAGVRL